MAAAFRLPGLDQIPPPLNQDEASRGYDAWCLLETGADRHGQHLPFFLKSFGPGDYTAALTTYLTVPFVAWLGPSPQAMRLPDALLGVATVLLLYLWMRRQVNVPVALLAAGILAVDPWHIALCRTAHESGFTPFFLVFALMALHFAGLLPNSRQRTPEPGTPPDRTNLQGPRRLNASQDHGRLNTLRRWVWGFLAGFMLALHTWAYPATRLFTPLLCIALVLIYGRFYWAQFKWRGGRVTLLAALGGLIIGAAPLWLTAVTHPEYLAARAQATLLIYRTSSAPEILRQFLGNYAANLDPRYWFWQADEMSGASIPHVGQHLLILAPVWCIGFVVIMSRLRRSLWSRLLASWLLLYPIPAAVCGDWNPHPLRSVAAIHLFPIITAIGSGWLLIRLRSSRRSIRTTAAVLAGLLLTVNVIHFANAYFRTFRPYAEVGYQTGLVQAFDFVAQQRTEEDYVLVTNWANQPYIYALLREPIWPNEWAQSSRVICDGPKGFDQVLAVGRFLFTPSHAEKNSESWDRFRALLANLPTKGRVWVIDVLQSTGGGPPDAPIVYRTPVSTTAINSYNKRGYVVRMWTLRLPVLGKRLGR